MTGSAPVRQTYQHAQGVWYFEYATLVAMAKAHGDLPVADVGTRGRRLQRMARRGLVRLSGRRTWELSHRESCSMHPSACEVH